MTKIPNDVRAPRELLESNNSVRVLIETFRDCLHRGKQPTFSAGDLKYFIDELNALLAKPVSQQGEQMALPADWRSLADQLQEVGLAYWYAHHRERGPGAVKFLQNEETRALFVITRGEYADQIKDFVFGLDEKAQPATAKVDERAEFDKWVMGNSMQGVSMFDVWKARANLNGGQS